jgi:hypothetical protein
LTIQKNVFEPHRVVGASKLEIGSVVRHWDMAKKNQQEKFQKRIFFRLFRAAPSLRTSAQQSSEAFSEIFAVMISWAKFHADR